MSKNSSRLEYFSQNEDESDEEVKERLLSQALPVSTLPKDADLSIPPATGEEYLSRVRSVFQRYSKPFYLQTCLNSKSQIDSKIRHEAKRCPDIVVAKVDVEKYKKKQTPQYFQQV